MFAKYLFTIVTLFSLTTSAHAADPTLQNTIINTNSFLGGVILPALMAIAFLFLAFNVGRYFILEADNEDGRANARSLAIYGTLAFVIIVIFWGTINFIANTFGANTATQPCPDYIWEVDPAACGTGMIPPYCNPGHPSYPGCLSF